MKHLTNRSQQFSSEFAQVEENFIDWIFTERFYPIGLLPACFNTKISGVSGEKVLARREWRLPLKIAPPDDRLTSKYFGVYHPDALHDFLIELSKIELKDQLNQSDLITSYSLPLPPRESEEEKVRGVADYLRMEEDISSDAWEYKYLIKLDVKHCYPSIYTHSIHWAIDGYENVRIENQQTLQARYQKGGKGGKVDASIQAMHGGFTKGLTVGPGASDLIIELLFRKIDQEISEELNRKRINAKGGRYKDDYRILLDKKSDVSEVVRIIEEILGKYLLHLNDEKTVVGTPFEILQRKWMVEYNSILTETPNNQKKFLWYLAHVAELQLRYPGKRLLPKFLSQSEYTPETREEFLQLVSVLLSLADDFKSAVPFVVSYIEKISLKLQDTSIASEYLEQKLSFEKNSYNALWYLYFLMNYANLEKLDVAKMNYESDPFCESILLQKDLMFPNRSITGSFFNPVAGPIFKQTEIFTELY